jgi:hypothetical protein
MASLKSGRHLPHQILAVLTPAKAEEILFDLANLPGEWPLIQNLKAFKKTESAIKRIRSRHSGAFQDCTSISIILLRDLARKAWTAADERSAEWYLFRLRHLHWETVRRVRHVQGAAKSQKMLEPEARTIPSTLDEAMRVIAQCEPPPATEIEAAAFYLQKNLNHALYCPDAECPAPYFFSKKKGQLYCSPACALPARRESKRRWWSQNRSKRRK